MNEITPKEFFFICGSILATIIVMAIWEHLKSCIYHQSAINDNNDDPELEFDKSKFNVDNAKIMYDIAIALQKEQTARVERIDKKATNLLSMIGILGGLFTFIIGNLIARKVNINYCGGIIYILFCLYGFFAIGAFYNLYKVLAIGSVEIIRLNPKNFENKNAKELYCTFALIINYITKQNKKNFTNRKAASISSAYVCIGLLFIVSVLIFFMFMLNLCVT